MSDYANDMSGSARPDYRNDMGKTPSADTKDDAVDAAAQRRAKASLPHNFAFDRPVTGSK